MVNIERLNHAVLYVGELDRATMFYSKILGFSVVVHYEDMRATFLRASQSTNHHDLGLFEANDPQPPKQGSIGLYHLAWQVPTIEDLVDARQRLVDAEALTGESDHGATKSLYGKDPDGNEFEIMWMLPRDQWGHYKSEAPTMRLDLEAEVERYGAMTSVIELLGSTSTIHIRRELSCLGGVGLGGWLPSSRLSGLCCTSMCRSW